MDDSERYYQALRNAIATLQTQLALLPPDDPRRDSLYRDLVWCYHEAFALLRRRIAAYRVRLHETSAAPRDR